MSDTTNPYEKAQALKPNATRDDCYWGVDEEDVLYDAYLILRDAGYEQDELEPLSKLVERTTIYTAETMEEVFETRIDS